MSEINRYLRVIEGDNPAGANLEYDDLYLQMEDLASNGDASLTTEDEETKVADYKALLKVTSNLLEQTRDFRVAVFHTLALTATQGFKGLKDGLTLLGFISVELWEQAYPQLDPEDDLDPTERLNILSALSPNSVNDPYGFLNVVMGQSFCPPLPLNSREVKIAKGLINSDEDSDIGLIKGQILSLPEVKYAEDYALIKGCLESAESLEQAINAQLSSGTVNLDKLKNELKFILRFLDEARGAPQVLLNENASNELEQLSNATSTASADAASNEATYQAYQAVNAVPASAVSAGAGAGATNLNSSPALSQAALEQISMKQAVQGQATMNQTALNQPTSTPGEMSVPLNAYVQLQQQVQQLQAQLQILQQRAAVQDIASLTIESRKDALALIDKCSAYFRKKEPNSPLPFLLQRALRMADMDFIQLLGEIDSSALERGREQLGIKPPEDN